jgi:hypothetical protein
VIKRGAGTQSDISTPFRNEGALSVQEGTVRLTADATHTGAIELLAAGTLALAGGTHALNAGVAFAGGGMLRVQTPLVLGADLNFGSLNVVFENSASVAGAFQLANSAGGTISFNKSMTIPGSMTIAGTLATANSSVTLTINGVLTLEASGVLDNPGTVRVGEFVNNGGTINGNAPAQIGGASPSALRIEEIRLLDDGGQRGPTAKLGSSERRIVIRWSAAAAAQFQIETSADMVFWSAQTAAIQELKPGQYEARVDIAAQTRGFFRLRQFTGENSPETLPAATRLED